MTYRIKTKEWSKVAEFYEDLSSKYGWEIKPMWSFANKVLNSPYVTAVYAYTSHATLFIGQYKELEFKNALVKIEHEPTKKVAHLSYKGDNSSEFTWQKVVDESRIFEEFQRLLSELKWSVIVNAT